MLNSLTKTLLYETKELSFEYSMNGAFTGTVISLKFRTLATRMALI